jgi:hypothetical protein
MADSTHGATDATHPFPERQPGPTYVPAAEERFADAGSALDEFPPAVPSQDVAPDVAIGLLESMLAGSPDPPADRERRFAPHLQPSAFRTAWQAGPPRGGATIPATILRSAQWVSDSIRRIHLHPSMAVVILLVAMGAGLLPLVLRQSPVAPLRTPVNDPVWAAFRTPVAASLPTLFSLADDQALVEVGSDALAAPPNLPNRVDEAQARRAIQNSLNRYRDAFSILDASAVKRVWPTVDERAMRDQFATLHEQNLEFSTCRIIVTPPSASAVCSGTLTSVRAAPSSRPRTEPRQWRFALDGDRDHWTIRRVVVSASAN